MIALLKKYSKAMRCLSGWLLSAVIVCSVLPGAVMAEGTESTSELPKRLMNGGFENPTLADSDVSLVGRLYKWVVQTADYFNNKAENHDGGFYWNTTAYDTSTTKGKIELGFSGNYGGYGLDKPKEGNQFAELCAEDQSSLYQNLKTEPGAVYNWHLSHAARKSATESMALFIGAKQESSLEKPEKGIDENNDIFMWMAQLLKDMKQIDLSQSSNTEPVPFTVYSRPDIDVKTAELSKDNYKNYFSLTKTDEISKEWKCWIITTAWTDDASNKWVDYSGTYDIPAGQGETTFAFTALTGVKNGTEYINEGNLLDNIVFETQYPLRVATTAGGTGTVYEVGNTNNTQLGTATYESDHTGYYYDGTQIKITAAPNANYTFIGAYIDKTFRSANNFDEDMSYTITMDKARYVQLVYAKDHTVIFDPNGGSYNQNTGNTEISMNTEHDEYLSHAAVYSDPNIQFIGWYVGRFPSYYTDSGPSSELGALIQAEATITYQNTEDNQGKLTTSYYYTYGDSTTQRTYDTDASTGLTFIAQWEYKQTAEAMTKNQTTADYTNSSAGGTVRITALKGNTSATSRTIETESDGRCSNGFGRLADTVTMKAVSKEGYVFMGWYENDQKLSTADTYTYEVDAVHTIEARFSKELSGPYLSFVSADGTSNSIFGGTHVKIEDSEVDGYIGRGGSEYGNTISTGFSTIQTFEDIAYDRCLWTITIPEVNENNPLYVKSNTSLTDAVKVLKDSDNVQYNQGTIYKINNNSTERTIKLLDKLPTISGEGQAVFGVILDNLYAPGATAALRLIPVGEADPTGIDISNQYKAESADGYSFYGNKTIQ